MPGIIKLHSHKKGVEEEPLVVTAFWRRKSLKRRRKGHPQVHLRFPGLVEEKRVERVLLVLPSSFLFFPPRRCCDLPGSGRKKFLGGRFLRPSQPAAEKLRAQTLRQYHQHWTASSVDVSISGWTIQIAGIFRAISFSRI
ncbi:hypothetical protein TESG_05912 [Trichophyton tonsurans CBS 112818]|uniref:Uncharacterized protein n=2 Tax=Trichophyton TaxID=5550 RepID=F2PJT1_TRIEC|nr:hypothetical protein TESG_05912 [Trichophyton tonsurans CBS 112818]EGE02149.1 hypothetical protein TEQG_01188 [Trichophyton equinum CBS 127.97]